MSVDLPTFGKPTIATAPIAEAAERVEQVGLVVTPERTSASSRVGGTA